MLTEVICQGMVGGGGGGRGLGVLPILACTWRVRSKGVPLSGFRYQESGKGGGFTSWIISKGREFCLRQAFHGCEKVE